MKKTLKILTWILMAAAIVLFWISLRTTTDQIAYTIAALVVWGLAFGVNYLLRKRF